ncbi:hypothetical protein D6C80_06572 [Aureobasidium pullulans]|nr:hypothetical protein D6C80_06572 [Aureobasidium pullulans]
MAAKRQDAFDDQKVYALCIEHEPNEPMPDKHPVAQRYLAQSPASLLLIWSGQGLDNVQSLAHQTRENAATIQSTLALNVVGKERTASDFSDMASAITRMLQIRTAVVLSQIDSIRVDPSRSSSMLQPHV